MENEETVEPLFEFEAPKYVDLRYAASEEGFNDGADNWFDQIQESSDPSNNNQFFLQKSEKRVNDDKNAPTEKSPIDQNRNGDCGAKDNMVTAREAYSKPKSAVSMFEEQEKLKKTERTAQESNNQHILTEATNQINLLSLNDQGPVARQKGETGRVHHNWPSRTENPVKTAGSGVNDSKFLVDPVSKSSALKVSLNEKRSNVAPNMVAKRVPVGCLKKIDTGKSETSSVGETEVVSSNDREVLPQSTVLQRESGAVQRQKSKTNKTAPASHTTHPQTPKFLTEERALRYRERLDKLREQSKPFIEPKTPKKHGLAWKPIPTQATTPHFRSDSRLRHCVEKAVLERNKQSFASKSTHEIPKAIIFGQHTARRAEMHKQKELQSHEEIELVRIECERKKLRKTIMQSRESFKRALEAPILATNSVQIRRTTVPKEFHFHTKGRSNRSTILQESHEASLSSSVRNQRPNRNL
jgi:hypothetical protein